MRISGWTWLVLLLGIAAAEWLLVATHHPTLSQWVWMMDAAHGWFRYVVLAGVGGLMLHFFWRQRTT